MAKERLTSGQVAAKKGISLEKACYILRRIGAKPERFAGHVRLFDAGILDDVDHYITNMRKHQKRS